MAKKREPLKPYPLGAHCEGKHIRFSYATQNESCGVILYDRDSGEQLEKFAFCEEERIGRIYCKSVTGFAADSVSYHFYEGDKTIVDRRARAFADRPVYGQVRQEEQMKAVLVTEAFSWGKDRAPEIPYEDCIGYCVHVRGFTMHPSSGVKNRGTFAGLAEKLSYLKGIGITTVELQPAYEFTEVASYREKELQQMSNVYGAVSANRQSETAEKLNYWGYKNGFYYTPKGAYAAGTDPVAEFKTMVKAFHKNGMELVMQFYFPEEIPSWEIPEILRFWVMEYHVDGFHLMGENLPIEQLAQDALLARTKLWYDSFDGDQIYGKEMPQYCNLAEYREDYLFSMRRFLKGDEDMLGPALYHMRHIPAKAGRIHYLSNYSGMTLKDMVSYDYKHNEENGESNRDGNAYNCTWNCGEEGHSRKKKVLELRVKQLKNALCLLFLSQSTPLIFMGDEFGNSQQGNNNPYCQDNLITWLDWKDLEQHQEIHRFWKELAALRKAHPILRPAREKRLMDYIACGYPDMSYHGQNAWQPDTDPCFRHIGIMHCGKYAGKDEAAEDDFFYVAINMHWESHSLALPKLPKGLQWEPCILTCRPDQFVGEPGAYVQEIPPRTIVLFQSKAEEHVDSKLIVK